MINPLILLMTGGEGTRLQQYIGENKKSLLPLKDGKRTIDHAMDLILNSDYPYAILSKHNKPKHDKLRKYLIDNYSINNDNFVYQKDNEPRTKKWGLTKELFRKSKKFSNIDTVIFVPEDLYNIHNVLNLDSMVKAYRNTNADWMLASSSGWKEGSKQFYIKSKGSKITSFKSKYDFFGHERSQKNVSQKITPTGIEIASKKFINNFLCYAIFEPFDLLPNVANIHNYYVENNWLDIGIKKNLDQVGNI